MNNHKQLTTKTRKQKKMFTTIMLSMSAILFSASVYSWTPEPEPNPSPEPCINDCTQGNDPTTSSVEANMGQFPIDSINVPFNVSGFGGGTIYYPSSGTTGTMGAIAMIPGFLSPESSMTTFGRRMASYGFVVITVATNSIFDQPDSRSTQLSRALDYVISQNNSYSSPISGMVDPSRLGAMGVSMGGGGTLQLSTGTRLKAAIPMVPWNQGSNSFNTISTPTLIIACENDTIAPVIQHASAFYNTMPTETSKAYLEINNGSHACAAGLTSGDRSVINKYSIAWMKRFIDDDMRYEQFLCGPNHQAPYAVSEYRENCANY